MRAGETPTVSPAFCGVIRAMLHRRKRPSVARVTFLESSSLRGGNRWHSARDAIAFRINADLHADGAEQIALAHRPDEGFVREGDVVHVLLLLPAPGAGAGAH